MQDIHDNNQTEYMEKEVEKEKEVEEEQEEEQVEEEIEEDTNSDISDIHAEYSDATVVENQESDSSDFQCGQRMEKKKLQCNG